MDQNYGGIIAVIKKEKVHSKFCKQYCDLSYNVADAWALGEC